MRNNIKYDRRTLKILLLTAIISAFMAGIGCFCTVYEVRGSVPLIVIGILCGCVFIYAGVHFLMGLAYLRRLQVYGYEIPYKRDDYGNDLQNVPCSGRPAPCTRGRNRGSMVLFFLYAAVFLLANVWNVRYIIYYHRLLGDTAVVSLVIMLLFDMIWGVCAVKFYRQGNLRKYRDDVEADEKRKQRTSIEKGLIDCVIILIILSAGKYGVTSLSDFALESRIDHDSEYLLMISDSVGAVMVEEGTGNTFDSYRQMCEGCYITDWDEPEDAFAQKVAEYIGISKFSELDEKVFTADGSPRIYVKIIGGSVEVRLTNPLLADICRYGFR